MNALDPARAAAMVLEEAGVERAIVGDLVEASADRSVGWLVRQTAALIGRALAAQLRAAPLGAAVTLAVAWEIPNAFMAVVRPAWIAHLNGWYPRLISLLLGLEWDGVRHAVYDLHVAGLTVTVAYCAFVAAFVRLCVIAAPSRVLLVGALVAATQAGQCVPIFAGAVMTWVHEPSNAMWFLNAFWFGLFAFFTVPATAVAAAVWRVRPAGAGPA